VKGVVSAHTLTFDFSILNMLTETFDISAITEKKRLLLYEKRRACSGPVYAHSGEKTLLVSGQGWGKEEGQKMCQYLQCGDYISHSTTTKDTQEWWSRSYNCSGKTDIWECERHVQAPQLHEQLNITCDKGITSVLNSYFLRSFFSSTANYCFY